MWTADIPTTVVHIIIQILQKHFTYLLVKISKLYFFKVKSMILCYCYTNFTLLYNIFESEYSVVE